MILFSNYKLIVFSEHDLGIQEKLIGIKDLDVEFISFDNHNLKDNFSSTCNSISAKIKSCSSPVILIGAGSGANIIINQIDKFNCNNSAGIILISPVGNNNNSGNKFPELRSNNFTPKKIQVTSMLITSNNDPLLDHSEAKQLAKNMGSMFINLGNVGGINKKTGDETFEDISKLIETFIGHISLER